MVCDKWASWCAGEAVAGGVRDECCVLGLSEGVTRASGSLTSEKHCLI